MKNKKGLIIGIVILLIVLIVGIVIFFVTRKEETKKEVTYDELINAEVVLKDNGVPKYYDGTNIRTLIKSDEDVYTALNEVANLYGFKESSEVLKITSKNSSFDFTYYKLNQVYRDIVVYNHQLVVAADNTGKVKSITGNYEPNISVSTYSSIKDKDAEAILKQSLNTELEVIKKDKYIYINDEKPVLTYIFSIIDNKGCFEVIMDANNGKILKKVSTMNSAEPYEYTGKDALSEDKTITITKESDTKFKLVDPTRKISIVDAYNVGVDFGSQEDKKVINLLLFLKNINFDQNAMEIKKVDDTFVYSKENGENPTRLASAVSAMDSIAKTYDYYKNKLGRTSYDNNGSEIIANIGVVEDSFPGIYGNDKDSNEHFNASWMGSFEKFIFGSKDGVTLATALDVVAHEFTHGVISSTANLTYEGESGALNEAYADIMGSLIEGKNFTLGEQFGTLRDMGNPNEYTDPAIKDGKYYFPTDTEYYNEEWQQNLIKRLEESGNPISDYREWDHKGVHTNSGVPNYAAYLMHKNGAFKDKDEMAKVFYNSLFIMTSSSDFEDCALAVIQSAKNLNISEDKITIIEEAFVETKMLARSYSTLSGEVKNKDDDEPLPYVLVTAINKLNPYVSYSVYTDKDGKYTFEKLPTTDYTISFEKSKFKTYEKEMSLKEEKEELNAKLEPVDEENYQESEIVFVMDISKSMDTTDPSDNRKYIISNILSSLGKESRVALVTFAKNAQVVNDGLSNKNVDKKIIATDIFNISNDNGSTDNSGTNGKAGISKGLSLFSSNTKRRKYIVFLTDGEDNVTDDTTYDDLIKKAKKKDVRILTIGLGKDGEINESTLINLANSTSGKYYHASDSTQLYKFDQRIFEELQ